MPCFVEFFVVFALLFAIAFGWDHRDFACFGKRFEHSLVRIEALIGQQCVRLDPGQQGVGAFQIAGLTSGEMESKRIAESIDSRVNLGAQASFAAPDGLRAAPFLRAPALC